MCAATRNSVIESLWTLLEPFVEGAGFELLEIEYVREGQWVVRLFADKPNLPVVEGIGVAPGQGISIDDCASLSRQISAFLDVEDVIPHAYSLEVSSPGAQRPLRKKTDFQRFASCHMRVRSLDPIRSEDPNFPTPSRNMYGYVKGIEEDYLVLDMEGHLFHVPWNLIAKAYLDPDMDAWLALASKTRLDEQEETGE
ncbi:MAG: ribosome maturation factor RimP [Myxococcales bacterium]|nr:ribosome maturation factor RimP [Myxococcales bacterium]MCB9643082.1 ribosome maturation factor RimP [Myxococcales bacterium]